MVKIVSMSAPRILSFDTDGNFLSQNYLPIDRAVDIANDSKDNFYVIDNSHSTINKISPNGTNNKEVDRRISR